MAEIVKLIKKETEAEALLWEGGGTRPMYDFLGGNPNEYMTAYGDNFRIDWSKGEGGLMIKSFGEFVFVKIGEYVVRRNHRDSFIYYSCNEVELSDCFERSKDFKTVQRPTDRDFIATSYIRSRNSQMQTEIIEFIFDGMGFKSIKGKDGITLVREQTGQEFSIPYAHLHSFAMAIMESECEFGDFYKDANSAITITVKVDK